MNLFKKFSFYVAILSAVAVVLFFTLPLPGTIPVLMYHFIGTHEDAARESNFVSRESFEKQMRFLKRFGYRVLSMEEYASIKAGRRKPQGREILITFDDGHRSFKNDALPVLKRYELPAVMFLISDSVQTGGTKGYEHSLGIADVKELQKISSISFQGHTKTHPHLKELPEDQFVLELEISKQVLEAFLGKPVNYFAYPFGETDRRIMTAVEKAGYKLAFTTSFKKLEAIPEGPYALTRNKVSVSSDNPIVFWHHISGLHHFVKSARQKIKYGIS